MFLDNLINRFYDNRFKKRLKKLAKSSLDNLDEKQITDLNDLAVELIDNHILEMIKMPMHKAERERNLKYGNYRSVYRDLKTFSSISKGIPDFDKKREEFIKKVIPLKSNVIQLLFHQVDLMAKRTSLGFFEKVLLFCIYYSEIMIELKLVSDDSTLYRPHLHNRDL
jgi:hypothetical protein